MRPVSVPLSSPKITEADRQAVMRVLEGPVLSIGPEVERFEAALAARSNRSFGVAVSSGTAALHLIVRALGWSRDAEVITTPFSFVSSANCLLYEGVRPVFVDIDPVTRCIDPDGVERAITSRTVGIVSVDVFGVPADWERLEGIAARHGLQLLTDSCESIGAARTIRNARVVAGQTGIAGAFAFYPNKQMTSGEGGAVVTDDAAVASVCRSLRNQGRDDGAGWLQHSRLGYNYRLSELSAALGLSQLQRLDSILAERAEVAARYAEWLAPLAPSIVVPAVPPETEVSWFVYVVQLSGDFSRADRDAILAGLRACGIGCSNYFSPIHLQPYFVAQFGGKPGDFPVTEAIADRTIALPFFTSLDVDRQRVVVDELARQLVARHP